MNLISPLASSMFSPAITYMAAEFKETNETRLSFSVSIYLHKAQYWTNESRKWCHDVVVLNIKGRWIVQREIYESVDVARSLAIRGAN
ncbi:uncharacterized protein ASPGLDRAFT_46372 [Aspergillus glaucus CBS 516.65]|uniref:Uncharacterized protein n=1 Tax=Aspergillus glaucus CBS 516.65 TaxID=1160497 RepID=A0A1L9VKM8_ASPGL|nr:hypothetical protein ASPGLDRAFT_46372 [Aspergillus glaucus CBS 516.65]OJJ84473.1 hypothetical protein ASPGLDRAFT_46372 [Aspergillus glaucus CBS 516.65]